MDFTYSHDRSRENSRPRAIINTGFDLNITPSTKVRGRTGFDIIRQEMVTTTVNVLRDLGCWEMALSWDAVWDVPVIPVQPERQDWETARLSEGQAPPLGYSRSV